MLSQILRWMASIILRHRSAADRFADQEDQSGLIKALDEGAIPPSEVEDAFKKAIASRRDWRALFFVNGLAHAHRQEVVARLIPEALDRIGDAKAWSALDPQDVAVWLQYASSWDQAKVLQRIPIAEWVAVRHHLDALPLQSTGAWLVARFGQQVRDSKVCRECQSHLDTLTQSERRELGRIVSSSRADATLELALLGLNYPTFALEIVRALINAKAGDLPWHRVSDVGCPRFLYQVL